MSETIMKDVIIDNFNFTTMEAQKYYSFTAAFKGNKTEKAKELVYSGDYLGSRKMDGAWAMIVKDNEGQFHLRSRKEGVNGGFVDKAEWIPQITLDLSYLPNGTVLIGEIYFPDDEGSRKITSVLNCLKEKCLERQKKNGYLHFYIFDLLAWNGVNWINKPFEERVNKINEELKSTSYTEVSQYMSGPGLWNLYNEVIALGGEGIVITQKDCTYLCGKRAAWKTLKLKKELREPIDAFVDGAYTPPTRIYTGKQIESWPYWINSKTGERFDTCKFLNYTNGEPYDPITEPFYFNRAGSISFSVYDNGVPRRVALIGGLPNQIKEEIITNPEKWIGKVAQLTGMQIEEIDGHYSFRHGRIECWRDDKAAEDCLYSQLTD